MAHRGETAVVFTDGSCKNQGYSCAKAGYGVFWADHHSNNRSGAVTGRQNSNRAELFAAAEAIKTAVQQGYSTINIVSDSTYVRQAVTNPAGYQTHEDSDLVQSIASLKNRIVINVQKVEGHAGSVGNKKADALARAGADSH